MTPQNAIARSRRDATHLKLTSDALQIYYITLATESSPPVRNKILPCWEKNILKTSLGWFSAQAGLVCGYCWCFGQFLVGQDVRPACQPAKHQFGQVWRTCKSSKVRIFWYVWGNMHCCNIMCIIVQYCNIVTFFVDLCWK